ncbi:MAG: muconolactone Delta-isomerase family protein [Chryseobacterium taeanense]
MERIIVNVICDLSGVPNLEALLPQELEAASQLKEKGVLEHVFAKSDASGAILVFKGADESQVKQYVANFPLAPYFGVVVYTNTEKHF